MAGIFGTEDDRWNDLGYEVQQWQRPLADIGPTFCQHFGTNVYMLRKYVRFEYPIDPERTVHNESWLLKPPQPSYLQPLITLERQVGSTSYFTAFGGEPYLRRLQRVERVLQWALSTKNVRVFRPARTRDLAHADDAVVEATVAYLLAHINSLPASVVTFLSQSGRKWKVPDFRIDAPSWRCVVEVKHIRKYPQSEAEQCWIDLLSQRPPVNRKAALPVDKLRQGFLAPTKTPRDCEQLPWQITIESIHDKLQDANEKLAPYTAAFRILVLHSDDPHTYTRQQRSTNDEPSENRIETGVRTWLAATPDAHIDAVLLLASPGGFPISTGYHYQVYPKSAADHPALKHLPRLLPPLSPILMRHALLSGRAAR